MAGRRGGGRTPTEGRARSRTAARDVAGARVGHAGHLRSLQGRLCDFFGGRAAHDGLRRDRQRRQRAPGRPRTRWPPRTRMPRLISSALTGDGRRRPEPPTSTKFDCDGKGRAMAGGPRASARKSSRAGDHPRARPAGSMKGRDPPPRRCRRASAGRGLTLIRLLARDRGQGARDPRDRRSRRPTRQAGQPRGSFEETSGSRSPARPSRHGSATANPRRAAGIGESRCRSRRRSRRKSGGQSLEGTPSRLGRRDERAGRIVRNRTTQTRAAARPSSRETARVRRPAVRGPILRAPRAATRVTTPPAGRSTPAGVEEP